MLITDYSSVNLDFELPGKPLLLYVPDFKWYRDAERGFYRNWPEDSLWFVPYDAEELVAEIAKEKRSGPRPGHLDAGPCAKSTH